MADELVDIHDARRTVLFLCEDNSTRSQIAQALLNHLYGRDFQAYSAGLSPTYLDEHVIQVMNEIGIDITNQRAKSVDECIRREMKFDVVATLCECSRRNCPFIPANIHMHKEFVNPAEFVGEHDVMLMHYRRLRDQVREWVETTFGPQGSFSFYSSVRETQ